MAVFATLTANAVLLVLDLPGLLSDATALGTATTDGFAAGLAVARELAAVSGLAATAPGLLAATAGPALVPAGLLTTGLPAIALPATGLLTAAEGLGGASFFATVAFFAADFAGFVTAVALRAGAMFLDAAFLTVTGFLPATFFTAALLGGAFFAAAFLLATGFFAAVLLTTALLTAGLGALVAAFAGFFAGFFAATIGVSFCSLVTGKRAVIPCLATCGNCACEQARSILPAAPRGTHTRFRIGLVAARFTKAMMV